MAIQKDKNDNEVWQNAKGFTSLAKLLQKQNEAIEEGNKDSKMTLKELRNSVDKSAQLNKNATDEQKDVVKRMGELQILGYDEASAESMARTGATLTALKEEREQLKDILENNGLNVPQDARIQALDSEIKSFEEIQKFGKTLTSFERGFHMFAGETFEELIKATQEGGKLTAKGITQGLGADLKGDFDKVLGFLGPAVGFLQQIPLLGTILNLGQNLAKRLFVELFLTRKSAKVDSVAQVKATATQTKVLHADAMAERRERRREVRRLKKNRMMDKRSGAIAGKEGKGKKGMNPFLFTAAGMFLTTLSMVAGKLATGLGALGSVIGTGFAAIGAAGPAILKGAAIFAAALVLIGGAVGAGGVMALKGIQKGFEGWDEAAKTVVQRLQANSIELRLEPGRSLLDQVGITVARVAHRKIDAEGNHLVGLEMNMSQLKSSSADFLLDPFVSYKHQKSNAESVPVYFTGAYCLERDILLKRKIMLPQLPEIGDAVLFVNTAGYMMHFFETEAHLFERAQNLSIAEYQEDYHFKNFDQEY